MDGNGWNDYYASNPTPWTRPDLDLVAEARRLTPGLAVDLGAGEGADSLWLASQGWQVSALDYAPAALRTISRQAAARGLEVSTRLGDVTELKLEPDFDLISICYLHMGAEPRRRMLRGAVAGLAPHGTFVYIGIARGPGGSDIPSELLAVPGEIVAELGDLEIERADARFREIGCPEGDFEAEVMVVRARRPS